MKKEFNIICPKCGSYFALMLTEKCFERGTYRKFCSTQCSHSRTFSKETKRKMSEVKMGKKMSIEFKQKRSEYMTKNNPMKGKAHSDSVKRKLSECMKKRRNDPKYRGLISNVMEIRIKE